ncbi:MAG TPA: TetR/AcrR family transcriptional regulator [Pseudonocardia sp.]|nr:TetR/AcrR family transcriptional regulator [Pseudonocardia sp.]
MVTARQRAREVTERAILEEARRQLAEYGAAALSLRAVARAVGLVSSAIYRYVSSREELLTRLIVEAYDALGEQAEAAHAAAMAAGASPRGRWRAVWRAVRTWALAHPAEYSLIYGSPVPGYAAPVETVAPATRVGWLLVVIIGEHGRAIPGPGAPPVIAPTAVPGLDAAIAPAAIAVWTQLIGTVSFELFGQYDNVVTDRASYLDYVAEAAADFVGLPVEDGGPA